jgi:hypothetical protein
LAATGAGRKVVVTEETDWLGGQLTSQMVPPDENRWIETVGGTRTYRSYREGVRRYYRDHFPLTDKARRDPTLNPGGGYVSPLCHEPRVGVAVIDQLLAPARAAGTLRTLLEHVPIQADTDGDWCRAVTVRNRRTGDTTTIVADFFLDATELGDLIKLAGMEYVTGAESRDATGEPHAVDGPAQPDNVQALTWCFPLGFDPAPGADHRIDKPARYETWRDYLPSLTPSWPGRLLDWVDVVPVTLAPRHTVLFKHEEGPGDNPALPRVKARWTYRRIRNRDALLPGAAPCDITCVNWPQVDYFGGTIIDQDEQTVRGRLEEARQLSLSFIYWLQTEAPNYTTGSTGYPGLFTAPEVAGSEEGLAKYPYIRESRRIQALFTVKEQHVGADARGMCGRAEQFDDSVGVGFYRIDLHMSTGGNNYIDVASYPFQIPLGALVPRRMINVLPAAKNLGVTHITNGCYRLHPVEWNIGESAGYLAAFCMDTHTTPRGVHEDTRRTAALQALLKEAGITIRWPEYVLRSVG